LFFITQISTFTWVLVAYVALHLGHDYIELLKNLSLNSVVLIHHISPERDFILRVKEVFLIVGSFALFLEIAKAATAKSFGASETLLSFVVAIVFVVMFFMVSWAQNATFLILGMMSLIDATGGFIIELNAARRDINIA
jgi:ABC-type Na+ efflux pump permease subunit